MAEQNVPDPNADPDGSLWRSSMPRDDRVKVCQHIMLKLAAYYRNIPETTLKNKTRSFEAQAFTRAVNRRDYLEKIADGLSKVESQVRENMAQANIPHPPCPHDPNGGTWRSSMPRSDRIKLCQHIMLKLAAFFQDVGIEIPETTLKSKTRNFEAQAFTRAINRRDYLEKIADGLTKAETSRDYLDKIGTEFANVEYSSGSNGVTTVTESLSRGDLGDEQAS